MHLKPFLSGRHLEAVHAFLILKRQYNTETIQHRSPALFFRSLSRLKAANSRVSLLMNLSMEGIKPQCVLVFWVLSVLGSSYLYLVWNRSRIQSSHWGGAGGRRVNHFPRDLSLWISLAAIVLKTATVAACAERRVKHWTAINQRTSDSFPWPLRELVRVAKWQWILKDMVSFANAASTFLWRVLTPARGLFASQFSKRKGNMLQICCSLLHLWSSSP